MKLYVQSYDSYLSVSKDRSRAVGIHYLSDPLSTHKTQITIPLSSMA